MSELKQKINMIVFIASHLGRRVDADKTIEMATHFTFEDLEKMVNAIKRGDVYV